MLASELVHALKNKMQAYGDLEVVVQLEKEHDTNDDGPFGHPQDVVAHLDKIVVLA